MVAHGARPRLAQVLEESVARPERRGAMYTRDRLPAC
eukprot:COSAG06_NODE_75691_length_128_cov_487.103448_1_plen_36_part_10